MTYNHPYKKSYKRLWKLKISAGMIAGIACAAPAAGANEHANHFELSPEQLFNATVMSVSKTSEKLMDAPAAIYVLTNEDIARSGATSIPETLRLVPGVQVARTHGGGWAVTVRGFASSGLGNKLLVLMDGREVYDQLFSGVYWDVQDTVLEDIERIEVIRGPGASLWGANAVNGVINIITKSAKDTQGGMVSALVGNQDRAITSGRFGGKIGSGYYRAYAKYVNRNEQRNLQSGSAHDPQQLYRTGFRSDWEQNDGKDSFTLQGNALKNENAQIRNSPLLLNPTREQIHATGWNILGRWTRELSEDSRLTVLSYVDYTYRDQLLIADQRTSYDFDVQYDLRAIGRHKATVGGRYRLSQDELTVSPFVTSSKPKRNDQLFSGFVQDKITLDPGRWFLTLGSKFEHNDYSGFEVQPNARLQWNIDEDRMAWASAARAVRTPSQLEQDLTISYLVIPVLMNPNFFGLQANPNFGSEDLAAYELGYRQKLTPSLMLDTAVFYNDYNNLANTRVVSGPFTSTIAYDNGARAESYGGEAMLNWRAHKRLNFSTAYTLLNIQMHGPAGSDSAEGQSPQQQFNARSQWNIRDDLSFDSAAYYVDSLPNFQAKPYWRFDMMLGWKINDGLQFDLVGQDLFSSANREFAAPNDLFTPATRIEPNFYGKLTCRF